MLHHHDMNFHRHFIRTRGKMTGERISKHSFKRKGLSNPNYREKISFKNKGKVMTFSDKEKLKDFFATRNYRKFSSLIPEGNQILRNKSSKLVNQWVA